MSATPVQRGVVHLKPLPLPDQLEFSLPSGHSCLVMDDGSGLSAQLADRLQAEGWPVALLRLPETAVNDLPNTPAQRNVIQLEDFSEQNLVKSLDEAARRYGPVAVFIHIQPACDECSGDGVHFTVRGKDILQTVFLAAKHLKRPLNQAGLLGRAAFMSVVRMDGEFGLGSGSDFDPLNGGTFGLVKSLNLEWESVFCRVLDLHPQIGAAEAVGIVLNELRDPNRTLVEVGYSEQGRATLALERLAR